MSGPAVRRVNVAACDVEHFRDLPGFRRGMASVGELLGASRTILNVYELPPGEAVGPYHYEFPGEEWLLVVDGRPTLRHPGGEDGLDPWDVVVSPPGSDGAHMVRNDTVDYWDGESRSPGGGAAPDSSA